jgi:hypothetical protein
MTHDEIVTVATQTRHDFKTKALKIHYLQSVIDKHLPYIAESYKAGLAQWIEQTIAEYPVNSCELATAVLLDRLQTGKIVYGRYEYKPLGPHNTRKSHSFWSTSDPKNEITLIADITADQYGGPPIYVGPLIQPWTIPDWSAIA